MIEFIKCSNPNCDSQMRWDEDDGEYSCCACASVLNIPLASRANSDTKEPAHSDEICPRCNGTGKFVELPKDLPEGYKGVK